MASKNRCTQGYMGYDGCDVNYFYNLRNAWIESFVSNLNDSFKYIVENNTKSIERI